MLPRQHRMIRAQDFTQTIRTGTRAGRSCVVIHCAPRQHTDDAALCGFVVSKAVGNAVIRNRVKRRLRHVMVARLEEFTGSCVVVRALPAAATASSEELADQLTAALAVVRRRERAR